MLRIVIRDAWLFAQVEAGKAANAAPEGRVVRVSQSRIDEGRQPFGMMQPIERNGKLFVVHAVAGHLDLDGLGRGVLPQMPLPRLLVEFQDARRSAECVEQGPISQAFDGVVRTVVPSPPLDAFQIAAIVEVTVVVQVTSGARRAQ